LSIKEKFSSFAYGRKPEQEEDEDIMEDEFSN